MSQENVELVRQGFADEFDRRFDDANLDEFFDPIDWVPVQQSLLASSEDRGYEGGSPVLDRVSLDVARVLHRAPFGCTRSATPRR
jgi:hypothetical protein